MSWSAAGAPRALPPRKARLAAPRLAASGQGRRSLAAAIILLATMIDLTCRRAPHLRRGKAAPVVVVPRSWDAGGPPAASESEPNNVPAQAQELKWTGSPLATAVSGRIDHNDPGTAVDVDVFKLIVPGQRPAIASDAGQAVALRSAGRRLSVTIAPEPGFAPILDLLDEALHVVRSLPAGPGETVGLPNMAVLPGYSYYLRVKPALAGKGRSSVDAGVPAGSAYRLTALLLDFEPADEREPNDRMESADDLTWQGPMALAAGLFGWRRDEDWYRLSLDGIDAGRVLNLELEGVDGVAASLTVNDSAGKKIARVHGRKGERLTLHNLALPKAGADAGAAAAGGRCCYLVVRPESGVDREHRYVLHAEAAMPEALGNSETEPNDDAAHASPLADGTTTGYLPAGDVDFFRYQCKESRALDVEASAPSRVKVKIEILRERDGQVLAQVGAAKANQPARLFGFLCPVEPILIRLSQGKYDGNASEPYLLKVASRLAPRDAGRRD